MQKYGRLPYIFFLIAASIGLLLRWHIISPVTWLKFSHWLHAHSHLMFLGWAFNFILLLFIHEYAAAVDRKKFITLYLAAQALLLIMLISFPLQGYGFFSIASSTLHTGIVAVITYLFFSAGGTKESGPDRWFAKYSLVFFLISFLGPLSLGPMTMNGLAQSKWYYFAVYYYLHFQYNGVFTFGVLSIFFRMLKSNNLVLNSHDVKQFGFLLLLALFPTYFLSTLWASPGLVFNFIGLSGALIQVVAFAYFFKIILRISRLNWKQYSGVVRLLLMVSLLAFGAKTTLQLLSAHPDVAQLAYRVRNYVMAYLHLVLLGMISSFLLAWSFNAGWISYRAKPFVYMYLIGFAGVELLLTINYFHISKFINTSSLLFVFSALLVSSITGFVYNIRHK